MMSKTAINMMSKTALKTRPVYTFCVSNQHDVKDGTKDPTSLHVEINDKKLCMELESGSAVSLISIKDIKKPGLKTKMRIPGKKLYKMYTHDIFAPIGIVHVVVKYGDQSAKLPLYVV